jgi:hypothetical protein
MSISFLRANNGFKRSQRKTPKAAKVQAQRQLGDGVIRCSHAAAKKITYFYLFRLSIGRLARLRTQSVMRILPAPKMRQTRKTEINLMLSPITSKLTISTAGHGQIWSSRCSEDPSLRFLRYTQDLRQELRRGGRGITKDYVANSF